MTPELRALFDYSDWANARLLDAAAPLSDDLLDRPLDIGPGSLRRILIHIHNGELVWLARWQGRTETRWPSESERVPITDLRTRFAAVAAERDPFLRALDPAAIDREQVYRDSKGALFHATLRDMLLQGLVHSIHHRAQAANALRRLGDSLSPPPPIVELDFMVRARRPHTA